MVNCAVRGCRSRSARDKHVSFFRIPCVIHHHDDKTRQLSVQRRAAWLRRLRRGGGGGGDDAPGDGPGAGGGARVCGAHFVHGKPSALFEVAHPDWAPSLALGSDKRARPTRHAASAREANHDGDGAGRGQREPSGEADMNFAAYSRHTVLQSQVDGTRPRSRTIVKIETSCPGASKDQFSGLQGDVVNCDTWTLAVVKNEKGCAEEEMQAGVEAGIERPGGTKPAWAEVEVELEETSNGGKPAMPTPVPRVPRKNLRGARRKKRFTAAELRLLAGLEVSGHRGILAGLGVPLALRPGRGAAAREEVGRPPRARPRTEKSRCGKPPVCPLHVRVTGRGASGDEPRAGTTVGHAAARRQRQGLTSAERLALASYRLEQMEGGTCGPDAAGSSDESATAQLDPSRPRTPTEPPHSAASAPPAASASPGGGNSSSRPAGRKRREPGGRAREPALPTPPTAGGAPRIPRGTAVARRRGTRAGREDSPTALLLRADGDAARRQLRRVERRVSQNARWLRAENARRDEEVGLQREQLKMLGSIDRRLKNLPSLLAPLLRRWKKGGGEFRA
ncbi:uncharacterized protein LOC133354996 [Lethenteron reissneri]|uniref:uncharacterized protein LOC133354996 n=1 Tax=Lethenteron reissneri TaxID=7753 RepID=UPI002AB70E75|nr:uncharacterized protein LOC133354996 [Lethenteron reissneri]